MNASDFINNTESGICLYENETEANNKQAAENNNVNNYSAQQMIGWRFEKSNEFIFFFFAF